MTKAPAPRKYRGKYPKRIASTWTITGRPNVVAVTLNDGTMWEAFKRDVLDAGFDKSSSDLFGLDLDRVLVTFRPFALDLSRAAAALDHATTLQRQGQATRSPISVPPGMTPRKLAAAALRYARSSRSYVLRLDRIACYRVALEDLAKLAEFGAMGWTGLAIAAAAILRPEVAAIAARMDRKLIEQVESEAAAMPAETTEAGEVAASIYRLAPDKGALRNIMKAADHLDSIGFTVAEQGHTIRNNVAHALQELATIEALKAAPLPLGKRDKLCWSEDLDSKFGRVALVQHGKDHFSVIYGLQVDAGLDYAEAAAKLGQALMHKLACDGLLDNREKGER